MATYEHDSLTQVKDEQGDLHVIYPITKADNVDGLDEAIQGAAGEAQAGLAAHLEDTSNPHHVTAEQVGADAKGTAANTVTAHNTASDAHAALFSALTQAIAAHLEDKDNPHEITPEQIGAVATALLGKPGGPAVLDKDGRLTSDQLGGTIGGGSEYGTGELEDTALEVGTFTNAGAGWNTFRFREAFEGIPHVVCQVEDLDCTFQIKNITATGFLYCLRTLSSGSYYTGASTGTQPSHSATTLVSGTTTTATAVKINYIAVEYGGER